MPHDSPAQRALTASTLALLVAVGALLLFLPPFFERFLTGVVQVVINALALATALLLHWVFLAIGARRLQRSVAGWVTLAVLLFPVGGAAALILLNWSSDEAGSAAPNAG